MVDAVHTRVCKSRSREFGGKCFKLTQGNCNIVCIHEDFQYGRQGRCYCAKPCGSHGKTPPATEPPPKNDEGPPENGPEADQEFASLLDKPPTSKI